MAWSKGSVFTVAAAKWSEGTELVPHIRIEICHSELTSLVFRATTTFPPLPLLPLPARRLSAVWQPQLYRTAFASPQLELWELDDEQWRKVLERSVYRSLKRPGADALLQQLALPGMATHQAS